MSAHTMGQPGTPGTVTRETTTIVDKGNHVHRRISWAAAFAGVVLAICVQLLLSMLGAAIGMGMVDPREGTTPDAATLGWGAGIWWLVSNVIALGFGGYVAAWLAGVEERFDGMLHGLVTWGIATLFTFYLLTTAIGSIIGGGFSMLGNVASTATNAIGSVAPQVAQATGLTPDALADQARRYLEPANPDPAAMSREEAQREVARNLAIYARGGADAAAARERVITIAAAQLNIPREEATRRFNEAQAQVNQTVNQAAQTTRNVADATASGVSTASLLGFVVLLLGAIAAAIGGSMAVQRRVALITTHNTAL